MNNEDVTELIEALKEAREVLLQLDTRHNGKCYNPSETDCSCTLCRITRVLNNYKSSNNQTFKK
jgi:hypothetical protein